jgi:CO dehydrogenase maturation factor
MAERTRQLAEGAGVQAYFILNKVDDSIRQTMTEKLDENRVIAVLPHSDTIFLQNLRGDALSVDFPELWTICDFIKKYQKPAALPFKL